MRAEEETEEWQTSNLGTNAPMVEFVNFVPYADKNIEVLGVHGREKPSEAVPTPLSTVVVTHRQASLSGPACRVFGGVDDLKTGAKVAKILNVARRTPPAKFGMRQVGVPLQPKCRLGNPKCRVVFPKCRLGNPKCRV
ncbi:MAG: hypothetical protein ACI3YD_04960, partial [Alloprevotella sp.]